MPMYTGIDGTLKELPEWYAGIDGTKHKVTQFLVSIDGTKFTIVLEAGTKVNFTFQNEATINPTTGNDTFQVFDMSNFLSQVIINGNTYSLYYNQPKNGVSKLSIPVEPGTQITIKLHSSSTTTDQFGEPAYGVYFTVNGVALASNALPKNKDDFIYVYEVNGSLDITLRCYGEPFPADADGPYTTGYQYVTINGSLTQVSGPNMDA